MKETDIAWCAGFFDGEGHASYRRGYPNDKTNNVSGSVQVSIPQASSNIEVLEFFQSVVGMGRLKGPYLMPNGKPQHVLIFGKKEIEPLFEMLKPYLKKEKTFDFKRAMFLYANHDSRATLEDHIRWAKRLHKKVMKGK